MVRRLIGPAQSRLIKETDYEALRSRSSGCATKLWTYFISVASNGLERCLRDIFQASPGKLTFKRFLNKFKSQRRRKQILSYFNLVEVFGASLAALRNGVDCKTLPRPRGAAAGETNKSSRTRRPLKQIRRKTAITRSD
ncbi:hypothetical protein EVAR_22095_1 [Eumeta japonica]|uniref:Uncharacterized protein n=1 Tax=Eumeta variegata TaxID=151549 RepID=A0A4C1UU08_EUMVA|nr:hypothetical protein EVAR_22095_1 [Eumeta japonica]